jgi:hypothetical protein
MSSKLHASVSSLYRRRDLEGDPVRAGGVQLDPEALRFYRTRRSMAPLSGHFFDFADLAHRGIITAIIQPGGPARQGGEPTELAGTLGSKSIGLIAIAGTAAIRAIGDATLTREDF